MRVFSLLLVLGTAACARTYGSGAFNGHPPPLPPGVTVPIWDYFCGGTAEDELTNLTNVLDEASANGWEMVSCGVTGSYTLCCFKRPHMGAPRAPQPPAATPTAPPRP